MSEPATLREARERLSKAESDFRSADGLFHLEEGLALLEDVFAEAAPQHRSVASNLLSTYSKRIYDSVRNVIERDPHLPQPDLEHLFKVLLAFDIEGVELPPYARALKIDVVKRLIDFHYEGYPPEEKQKMLQQLAGRTADDAG